MASPSEKNHQLIDLAIVGGGAAGLIAALHAARHGSKSDKQIIVLEGSAQFGQKLLASGGGRCNVLPARSSHEDFHTSGSRNVLKRLLRTWRLQKQQEFFEVDLAIPLQEEEDTGKLFPKSQKARDVRDALLKACIAAGVKVVCDWKVNSLSKGDSGFTLISEDGKEMEARRALLATGGKSVPSTGSDGFGFELAQRLGHSTTPTYPALVPLLTKDDKLTALSGISFPVTWQAVDPCGKCVASSREETALLFTHHGFSGPAVMDASHWHLGFNADIHISWGGFDDDFWMNELQSSNAGSGQHTLVRAIQALLPKRLAELIPKYAGLNPDKQLAQLGRKDKLKLIEQLVRFKLPISGSRGFEIAEATCGGIPLDEIDPRTLESRKCPGLYFCGEILDVHGRIGGFNFQWAWTTGKLAGESAVS